MEDEEWTGRRRGHETPVTGFVEYDGYVMDAEPEGNAAQRAYDGWPRGRFRPAGRMRRHRCWVRHAREAGMTR